MIKDFTAGSLLALFIAAMLIGFLYLATIPRGADCPGAPEGWLGYCQEEY